MTTPMIFAHRGASQDRRENTVEAYLEAVAQGADWVELDVHLLADGTRAVYHDNQYSDQVAGRPDGDAADGETAGKLMLEMTEGDLPEWMPTLGAALDACTGCGVNVEIKAEGPAASPAYVAAVTDAVVAALARVPAGDRPEGQDIIVSSFNFDVLEAIRPKILAAPLDGVVTGALGIGFADMHEFIAKAVSLGCAHLHPWHPQTTPAMVDAAHAVGLGVNVWTANEPELVQQLAAMGVDGIITDCPAAVRAALAPAG